MTQISASAKPFIPVCPRCDYDLAGEVATWTAECPLTSRCPECGLDVNWLEVHRTVPPPAWSIEHVEVSGLRLVGPALASAVLSFAPGRLWKRLTLAMAVVPSRLALMLGCWIFASYAIAALGMLGMLCVESGLDSHLARLNAKQYAQYPSATFVGGTIAHERWILPFFRPGRAIGVPLEVAALSALFPLVVPVTLVLMPMSLRRAKVKARHVVRLTGYWLVWVPILAVFPSWTDSVYRSLTSLHSVILFRTAPGFSANDSWAARLIDTIQRNSNILASAALFLLVAWYWRHATKHYLKLPRPTMVAAGLVGISALFTMAVGYFLVQGGDHLVTAIFYELFGR